MGVSILALADLMMKDKEKFSSNVIDFSPTSRVACAFNSVIASKKTQKKKKKRLIAAI
jgi:hypothetical protein